MSGITTPTSTTAAAVSPAPALVALGDPLAAVCDDDGVCAVPGATTPVVTDEEQSPRAPS